MKAIEINCEWNTMPCIVEPIIEEQLSKGILERFAGVKDNEREKVRYLPHHAVIRRDRKTTKLRNVHDSSAKHTERTHSLNNWLETGPNYTPHLFDTMVNFRWHKIGLTTDIEKAIRNWKFIFC